MTTPSREAPDARADNTPMIDVVFLLIIFFLCIDFRVLEAKLPAYLPKDRGGSPDVQRPREQLSVRVICENWGTPVPRPSGGFRLLDHRIRWQVGPLPASSRQALQDELSRAFGDRKLWRDEDGQRRPPPIVIEPGVRTTYGDVAATLDEVRAAGFDEVLLGGGAGPR